MSYKNRQGELIKYIRPDGTVTHLNSPPNRAVRNMTGWGYPPVNTHNIAGPFQHGTSWLGYRFQPRTISMDIIKPNCSRSEWFEERTKLIDRLGVHRTNPNLPTPGRLQWEYVENGAIKRRALNVYLNRGLGYSPDPQWWQWGILEQLDFIASDPIIYDPTQITVTINSFDEELILPMTFPFILGASTTTQNITYTGTWPEFPVIEVDGPTNGFYIENSTLEVAIQFDYFIPTGITVTFDLTTGAKTVTDSNGNNLIQFVTINSNLAQFVIERDPFAVGGVNSFFVSLTDIDVTTEVRIKYFTRYAGI